MDVSRSFACCRRATGGKSLGIKSSTCPRFTGGTGAAGPMTLGSRGGSGARSPVHDNTTNPPSATSTASSDPRMGSSGRNPAAPLNEPSLGATGNGTGRRAAARRRFISPDAARMWLPGERFGRKSCAMPRRTDLSRVAHTGGHPATALSRERYGRGSRAGSALGNLRSLPAGSHQLLKARVVAQVPPPPVGHLRQADSMLRVGGDLLLEHPDRPVPIPQQRIGERGPVEQVALRIDLRVVL